MERMLCLLLLIGLSFLTFNIVVILLTTIFPGFKKGLYKLFGFERDEKSYTSEDEL